MRKRFKLFAALLWTERAPQSFIYSQREVDRKQLGVWLARDAVELKAEWAILFDAEGEELMRWWRGSGIEIPLEEDDV